jgi:hypothetical protein
MKILLYYGSVLIRIILQFFIDIYDFFVFSCEIQRTTWVSRHGNRLVSSETMVQHPSRVNRQHSRLRTP